VFVAMTKLEERDYITWS